MAATALSIFHGSRFAIRSHQRISSTLRHRATSLESMHAQTRLAVFIKLLPMKRCAALLILLTRSHARSRANSTRSESTVFACFQRRVFEFGVRERSLTARASGVI